MQIQETAGELKFVPVFGVKPPPRELSVDEDFPLYAGLCKCALAKCEHPQPHRHLKFMGDDGIAWLWPPIYSSAFLEFIFQKLADHRYFASNQMVAIRALFTEELASLPAEALSHEQQLMETDYLWASERFLLYWDAGLG